MPKASNKHKIFFPSGYAKDSSGSAVESIIAPKGSSCCFVDCCCNCIWMVDRVTGERTAMALENGVFVAYAEKDFVCNNGKIPEQASEGFKIAETVKKPVTKPATKKRIKAKVTKKPTAPRKKK